MIERLLADVRRGRSGALVVRGEAGIGKSALLDHAASAAEGGMRVLRGAGVEPEMELPFAGLHLLLRSALAGIGALPAPQAEALRGALGLVPAPCRDHFLVGLAVLTLLADLAERSPLVCLVDDAHWLDHASAEALLFAARRLEAEGVALIFAARDDDRPFPAPGVAELRLAGLDAAAAAELLAEKAADLAPRVRDRILEDASGNPLALLELPATLSPAQRRGELPVRAVGLGEVTASSRIRQTFCDRVAALPAGTGALLLIAAADDTGRLDVVLDAARRLSVSLADVAPAETARLVRVADGRLVFRHPLIRAAVYQNAPVTLRLAAHRALAESLDGRADDADRRAWHLASAAIGPDEDTAAALERCAEHARTRGGYAAVAAAYQRAAQLTPTRPGRGRRLVAAATAAVAAGWYQRAAELAEEAIPDLDDPLALARAAHVRATVAAAQGRPREAHVLLAEAADMSAGRDDDAAAVMYFEATTAAWLAADFAAAAATARRAAALRPRPEGNGVPLTHVAPGPAHLTAEESPRSLAWLGDVMAGLHDHKLPLGLQQRAKLAIWDLAFGDDNHSYERALAIEHECRTQGAVGVLPTALALVARSQIVRGLHRDGLASAEEGLRVARDTGQRQVAAYLKGVLAILAALEGDEGRCRTLTEEIGDVQDVGTRELRLFALNLLDVAMGRYEAAMRRDDEEYSDDVPAARVMMALHRAGDVVEAAVRMERSDIARTASEWFSEWAAHTRQPWAEAVALRCRALLASGRDAERYYADAVRLHRRGGRPFERARTELLYGEWLRRAGRRADARPVLRSAWEIFERLGARPWADRAHAELRATGERRVGSGRGPGGLDRLTPQELQVIRLAAAGLSNRQIAARLFLSPRTVGYHLYKAFPKLGVASRRELAGLDLGKVP